VIILDHLIRELVEIRNELLEAEGKAAVAATCSSKRMPL
jgi:hypothetical protein